MIVAPFQVWGKKSKNLELKEYLRWDLFVIVATIPAAVIGLAFKDQIEKAFSNVLLVYFMLAITGFIMIITPKLKNKQTPFSVKNTFIIGIAQAFAILPGISRSGSTISVGLLRGVDKKKVAKFSFLLSIPAVIGATIFEAMNVNFVNVQIGVYLVGVLVLIIVGYLSLKLLLRLIIQKKFHYFAYYCWLVGLVIVFLL